MMPGAASCAVAARYDRRAGDVTVDLGDGRRFAFHARRVQGLETADDAALATVELLGRGLGLRWDALDVDVSVAGLLAGRFGSLAWCERQQTGRGEG